MRWGVVSDLHANLPAFEAALAVLERERVDGLICAGDLVGYGPHPNQTVALVQRLDAICVAGNHDLMAIDRLSTDHADDLARVTLAWTRDRLDRAARAYLEALPIFTTTGDVAIAHGTLTDPSEYVSDDGDAAAVLAALTEHAPGADVLLLGHTHQRAAYAERGGRLPLGGRGELRPPPGERWLLNPGSVGQPREWRRVVRFAVIDTASRCARLHAIGYDHRRTARDLAVAGLPARAVHRRPRLRSQVKRALSAPRR